MDENLFPETLPVDTDLVSSTDAVTIVTDQPDYAPGSTATFTASGFEPGSAIAFTLQDDPNDPGDDGDADSYAPFTVTDGSTGDLDGEVNGQVVTTWTVPDTDSEGGPYPDALNATLQLTATGTGADGIFGTADDQVATTTFTDAQASTNKVYQHWADAGGVEWNNNILNDNKSDYFEGEVIPHVFFYKACLDYSRSGQRRMKKELETEYNQAL